MIFDYSGTEDQYGPGDQPLPTDYPQVNSDHEGREWIVYQLCEYLGASSLGWHPPKGWDIAMQWAELNPSDRKYFCQLPWEYSLDSGPWECESSALFLPPSFAFFENHMPRVRLCVWSGNWSGSDSYTRRLMQGIRPEIHLVLDYTRPWEGRIEKPRKLPTGHKETLGAFMYLAGDSFVITPWGNDRHPWLGKSEHFDDAEQHYPRIELYMQAIRGAAADFHVDAPKLFDVVLLHELAHMFHFAVPVLDEPCGGLLPKGSRAFREWLAQHLTDAFLREYDDCRHKVFQILSTNSPAVYQTWSFRPKSPIDLVTFCNPAGGSTQRPLFRR